MEQEIQQDKNVKFLSGKVKLLPVLFQWVVAGGKPL